MKIFKFLPLSLALLLGLVACQRGNQSPNPFAIKLNAQKQSTVTPTEATPSNLKPVSVAVELGEIGLPASFPVGKDVYFSASLSNNIPKDIAFQPRSDKTYQIPVDVKDSENQKVTIQSNSTYTYAYSLIQIPWTEIQNDLKKFNLTENDPYFLNWVITNPRTSALSVSPPQYSGSVALGTRVRDLLSAVANGQIETKNNGQTYLANYASLDGNDSMDLVNNKLSDVADTQLATLARQILFAGDTTAIAYDYNQESSDFSSPEHFRYIGSRLTVTLSK